MDFNILPISLIPLALILTAFWGGDKLISENGCKVIYNYIVQTINQGEKSHLHKFLKDFIDKNYSFNSSTWRPFKNVAIYSLITMLIMLCVYILHVPAMTNVLLEKSFIKQFILNGFSVVFLVNSVTLYTYPYILRSLSKSSLRASLWSIMLEALLKAVIFLILTLVIWTYFAYADNAFGGAGFKGALDAIPVTLLNGIQFKSLTSVYLYSVAMSSIPFYLVFLIQLMSKHQGLAQWVKKLLFWLPLENKPIRIATILLVFIITIVFSALLIFIYPMYN